MRFIRYALPMVAALVLAAPAIQAAEAGDKAIAEAVRAKLSVADPDVARSVEIDAQGGVVTLKGTAMTAGSLLKALNDTRSVPGVVKVVNHLAIRS
jgi:osmotically-inducible protein OsmY